MVRVAPSGTRTALATGLAALLLLVGTVGCGAPEFTYVTNSTDRTYVKIPHAWQPIDQRQLDAAFGLDPAMAAVDAGIWHVGYDAAAVPATDHLIGWSATEPVVLVGVRQVPASQRGQFSFDGLRDMFLPVSTAARQQIEADPAAGGGLSDFGLFADEVLTPGTGVRGVHTVFRYRLGAAPPQMIDQTVYLNDDASRVYMLFVRCTTTCYSDRQEEIQNIVSSFTVRGHS